VRDATALADALRPLLADAALRQRYGAAARAMAEAEFDVRSVVAQTVGVWHEALA
jgi:glycosyltransferase involved in cell wall biosynthesis